MLNFFLEKLKKSGRPQKIYILPTLDGIKLLILNITLLIIGLVYANNYILLFNFILFGIFLCSMFYTHFNLEGLKLESTYLPPTSAGGNSNLILLFKSTSKLGHHYINISLESKLVQIEEASFSFINSNENFLKTEIEVNALRRGVENISQIRLETLFPFHLFRCISYHPCNLEIIVHPRLSSKKLFLETYLPLDDKDETSDLNLRDFEHGDSYARVDWKKLAQTHRWYTKVIRDYKNHPVILQFQDNDTENIEPQISSIATQIRYYQNAGTPYGINLTNHKNKTDILTPSLSQSHLNRCLKFLAQYEY